MKKETLIPAIVTGLIGLLSGMALNSQESELSKNRYFLEKQVAAADAVAINFAGYIENWRRMRTIKVSVGKRQPTAEERKRFNRYVASRDDFRDRLFASLDKAELYFDDDMGSAANKFREWDTRQATKTLAELPGLSEWKKQARRIFSEMRKEMRQ